MGADLTQSDDNVCLPLMAFRFHFSFANSFRSNFRVCADLPDTDRPQSPARSDRWGRRFPGLHWTPLHFAADAGKLEIVKILVAEGVKLNELTKAVYSCLLTSFLFPFNDSILGGDQSPWPIANVLVTHGTFNCDHEYEMIMKHLE
jgi:ankyrin repeat protein